MKRSKLINLITLSVGQFLLITMDAELEDQSDARAEASVLMANIERELLEL